MIELSAGDLRAVVVPEIGAGLARFDWRGVPLMRPWDGKAADPTTLACCLLIPWSNRISGGGIEIDGRLHPLPANLPGEPCPIHGDAWQRSWEVLHADRGVVRLGLDGGVGPFRYSAEVAWRLTDTALEMGISVSHTGEERAPYGVGLHPWFPRTPGTTLRAPARAVWLEDERHLPTMCEPLAERPGWDFGSARVLPASWINNAFTGWDGKARIVWPECAVALDIEADPGLDSYILYGPSADADFFCFEPVSHPVDAHHLPGLPGLVTLARGESLRTWCRFRPVVA